MTVCQQKSRHTSPNQGMPLRALDEPAYSFFEFWPAWVFYIPVVAYCVVLAVRYRSAGLPMVVNPHIALGGMVGESKAEILSMAGDGARAFILPFLKFRYDGLITAQSCLQRCAEVELTLPLVVKPDLGCRGAGVCLIDREDQLQDYLAAFPRGRDFLMQKLAPYEAEAGIFYVREPNAACGRVVSITLKYRPVVVGDGKRSLRELILSDSRAHKLADIYFERQARRLDEVPQLGEQVALSFAGSHARGSIFRNGNGYASPALEAAIDGVMQDFPAFHYGRLDIKFADIADLMRGENFAIIEVNGVSSEATHIWDSRTSLREVLATLCWQYRTLFSMGAVMRAKGHRVPSLALMIKTWIVEWRRAKAYPRSD